MYISNYESKFEELSKSMSSLAFEEKNKVKRFQKGLRANIRIMLEF